MYCLQSAVAARGKDETGGAEEVLAKIERALDRLFDGPDEWSGKRHFLDGESVHSEESRWRAFLGERTSGDSTRSLRRKS